MLSHGYNRRAAVMMYHLALGILPVFQPHGVLGYGDDTALINNLAFECFFRMCHSCPSMIQLGKV